MEKIESYELPITIEECGKITSLLRNAFLEGNTEITKKLDKKYIELLDMWGAFLNSLSFIIDVCNRCEGRGFNLKELKEKGFIK